MKNKNVFLVLIIGLLVLSSCEQKHYNEWVESFGKKQYYNEKGEKLVDCYAEIDDNLYFFDNKGNLLTDTIVKYGNERGIVFANGKLNKSTGLRAFKDSWYYLRDGKIQKGIVKESGSLYYFDEEGKLISTDGWHYDNKNNTYVYTIEGKVKTGWIKENDNWYYILPSGYMSKNWQNISGKWYYFDKNNGDLQVSKWIDNTYYVNENGEMLTSGYHNVGGQMLYFESNGKYNATRNYEQEIAAQQKRNNQRRSNERESDLPQFKYVYNANGIQAVFNECVKYYKSIQNGNKTDAYLLHGKVAELEALVTQAKGYGMGEALAYGISSELETEYRLLNSTIVGMKRFVLKNMY